MQACELNQEMILQDKATNSGFQHLNMAGFPLKYARIPLRINRVYIRFQCKQRDVKIVNYSCVGHCHPLNIIKVADL